MRDAKLREQKEYEHVEPASMWTVEDSAKADAEGWNLFNVEEGQTDLEKDDEAAKFESDDDAVYHVIREARRGSELHLKALKVWKWTNPTEYHTALQQLWLIDLIDEERPAPTGAPIKYPRTWWDVAIERGAKVDDKGSINGAEFARVGIQMINGCPNCQATVAPYNSYQMNEANPYAYCRGCAGVEEAPEPADHVGIAEGRTND